ncbi:MAG: hypothetical protein RIQ52_500 [Pseudomonadota bacterium]|jgi:class 3 adenylate cyclase
MKRIMYISSTTRRLGREEVDGIGARSMFNNSRVGVTGILFSAEEFFFQILEGEEAAVDATLDRIRRDERHQGLLILKVEPDISERLFPFWSMKTVQLGHSSDMMIQAIRIMLENITESHRVIERYTQPAVLQFLTEGVNPLAVPLKRSDHVILFADIVAFSHLSGMFPVEEVADLVNSFLAIASDEIVAQGGHVNKYVGDGIMAYFSPDLADGALAASMAILEKLQQVRASAAPGQLKHYLYAGLGLTLGPVIVGNFGSRYKMDYTVLGDSVNLAARVEHLTRSIGRCLAMSEAVKEACSRPDWPFQEVGRFQLKGQMQWQTIFSLDDPLVRQMKNFEQIARDLMETSLARPGIIEESAGR